MQRKEKPAIKGRAGKVFALDYGRLMGVPYCSGDEMRHILTRQVGAFSARSMAAVRGEKP